MSNSSNNQIIEGPITKKAYEHLNDEWMTTEEAAGYLKVTPSALFSMNARREIRFYKAGKRRIRYNRLDLDKFLAGHVIEAVDPDSVGGVS